MMRFAPSRDFYIPNGSVKIADKTSDGIVYVYTSHKASRHESVGSVRLLRT